MMRAAMFNLKIPSTCDHGGASVINAVGAATDAENFTEVSLELQLESFAVSVLQRRFRLSYWHALVVIQASGLGGAE